MLSLRDLSPAEMRQRATIYSHIPKTAGMTLRSILIYQYPMREIFPAIEQEAFRRALAMPPQVKARYKLFQGHMPFGLHETLSQPSIYITMLRDPIQTVLSSYFYFELNYRRTQLHLQVEDVMPTIADLEHGKMKKMFNNLQTRFVSGQLVPEFGACTREMLAQAQEHLHRYYVFGIVEQFDEALVLMAHRLGWRFSPFYVKTNVARTRPRGMPDKEVMAWLREYNQLDLELYAYAKTLFARLVAEQGEAFPAHVAKFCHRNQTYGRFFDVISRAKNRTMRVLQRATL